MARMTSNLLETEGSFELGFLQLPPPEYQDHQHDTLSFLCSFEVKTRGFLPLESILTTDLHL